MKLRFVVCTCAALTWGAVLFAQTGARGGAPTTGTTTGTALGPDKFAHNEHPKSVPHHHHTRAGHDTASTVHFGQGDAGRRDSAAGIGDFETGLQRQSALGWLHGFQGPLQYRFA